jgi:hypothetical protein
VGVGIANPQRALEVAGDLVVSGTISGGAGMGSFRNRIINGDMRIAQRGASNVVPSGTYSYYGSVDRWKTVTGWTGGQMTASQQTLTASDTPYQIGFRNSMRFTINSALTGFSYFYTLQQLELVNVVDFNLGLPYGSPFTVSFWFRSNIPAGSTMSAAIQTYISSQMSYVTEFKTTGTWQYVTFTVPPMTTAQGVLNSDNFLLAIGSLYAGAGNPGVTPSSNINTWASGINSLGSAAMYPWWTNAGNYIEFTGVQLEKGTVATPFEFRPYATELQLCQRYYEKSYSDGVNPGTNTEASLFSGVAGDTAGIQGPVFRVTKRATPTMTFWARAGTAGNVSGWTNTGTNTAYTGYGGNGANGCRYITATVTAGALYTYHWSAEAEL